MKARTRQMEEAHGGTDKWPAWGASMSETSMSVTVLGAGAMGSGVASNLVTAGFSVVVWNRTGEVAAEIAERIGARAARNLRDAVGDADVVVSTLTDDVASREVWLDPQHGALASLRAGTTIIESSTVTPGWARELAGHAAMCGCPFLEAPMVGSRPQLAARQLRYFTAGDLSVLDHVRGVLAASSTAIDHVGEVGRAATLKLAVNALLAVQVAAHGELLGLLERSGIDMNTATEVLRELPVTSPALARALTVVMARDVRPNFPVRLVDKDLGYLGSLSAELGAELPMALACLDVVRRAGSEGHGDDDITAIAVRYLGAPC